MLSNELGMNVFFFKMAGGKSKHIELTEESRGTAIFAEGDVENKRDTGQQN